MTQANFVQDGYSIDHTPSAAVTGGDVIELGTMVTVAKNDIAADALGAVAPAGVFDVVKVTGVIALGVALYWDNDGDPLGGTAGTGCATTVSAGNNFMGYVTVAALDADTTVRVLMVRSPDITIHNDLTAEITDPDDAGAIPITNTGHVDLVTAGAETRTLAAPTYAGQMLLLSFKTDSGDCVVTCATTINQTGNNTITMADIGDIVLLVGKTEGSNTRWSVVVNDGCALSTV